MMVLTDDVREINALDDGNKYKLAERLKAVGRALVESVFSITYVFENPTARMPHFWKGDVVTSKLSRRTDRIANEYKGDTRWQDAIAFLTNEIKEWEKLLGEQRTPITGNDRQATLQVFFWPMPRQIRPDTKDPARRARLDYLYTWLYDRDVVLQPSGWQPCEIDKGSSRPIECCFPSRTGHLGWLCVAE
jgi:hypothetical protein